MGVLTFCEDSSSGAGGSGAAILVRLKQAKQDRHDRAIHFQQIQFSEEIVQAVVDLLSCDRRKWELIQFTRCTGPIHVILARVLQLETAHTLELVDSSTGASKSNWEFSSSPLLAAASVTKQPPGIGKGYMLSNNTSLTSLTRIRVAFSDTYPVVPPGFSLKIHPNMHELDISGSWFRESSVPTLVEALERNRTLRVVRFKFFAGLEDAEISQLVRAVETNPSLQGLEIGQYSSGSITLDAIASLVRGGMGLTWLRIRHQALRNDQVPDLSQLAAVLAKNSSLTSVDLSLTTVSDDAMDQIGTALRTNTTLQHLFLNHCAISSSSIQAFCAKHLPHMKGLKTLDLTGNQLDQEQRSKELILEGVQTNWQLEHISLQAGDCILSKEIGYYLDLNRSGRRLLQADSDISFIPPALWPLVLERADKKIMLRVANDGPADRRERRASVLYYLLREHVLLER